MRKPQQADTASAEANSAAANHTSHAESTALEMPELYHQLTTPPERARHTTMLKQLGQDDGILVEARQEDNGHWRFELATLDWEEPGLLDKIFEAILRCHQIPEGVAIRRTRSFTSKRGQVVTVMELSDSNHQPLSTDNAALVLEHLRAVRREERGVLETIEHMPVNNLIPLLEHVPHVDNLVSEDYTRVDVQVNRLSNRFTSVLLHFIARSALWLNVQMAVFEQGEGGKRGHYTFYVVDKQGQKLRDNNFLRLSQVEALEAMNAILIRFNTAYIRRSWTMRIEHNDRTIYHSRPNLEDTLRDLENIRQLANLKGFDARLTSLVDAGVLDSRSFYFIKKVERFVETNLEMAQALRDTPPDDDQVAFCRKYFEYRHRFLRLVYPLFEKLAAMPTRKPLLSDKLRLRVLSSPLPMQDYALDERNRLYIDGPIWLGEPIQALEPYLLMARTDCFLRQDTVDALEASLEGWNEHYIAENLAHIGQRFLAIVDESVQQGNSAIVMRNMRSTGLLQRYIPGFKDITGRVHINSDHAYTVDEHSMVVIEVLLGLKLMGDVFPEPGKSKMRVDYEHLKTNNSLKTFVRKYAMELRMLNRAGPLRNNPTVRPFFSYVEDVRVNSLEYLVEVNMLEHGYETCMAALTEMEKIRNQLNALIRLYKGLPFSEQRVLTLTGLLHDLKKPAVNHDEIGGDALPDLLKQMGLPLSSQESTRLEWLIRNHLHIRPLMVEIGTEGDEALAKFAKNAGDFSLLRSLILFTFADRVAVSFDRNKNSHDAMVLGGMLNQLDRLAGV